MKNTLSIALLLVTMGIVPPKLHAQEFDLPEDYWKQFEMRSKQMHVNHNILIGSGLTSVVAGSITALSFQEYQDFGFMTAGWGMINTSIGYLANRNSMKFGPTAHRPVDPFLNELQLNRIVAINVGLDVGYIAGGLAMQKWGTTSQVRQFGTAVALQGAFLLVFDVYLLRQSNKFIDRVIGGRK